MPSMLDAQPVRKEVDLRAPSAPQLELRLRWFGHALEARRGYIVRLERRRHGGEHVASVAYEMPLPRYGRLMNGQSRQGQSRYGEAARQASTFSDFDGF